MRIGVDGRKIPEAAQRGPLASLDHGKSFGMEGLFYRTVLDMSPTLDRGEMREISGRADELGMYVETGLGKVNPYASAGGAGAARSPATVTSCSASAA